MIRFPSRFALSSIHVRSSFQCIPKKKKKPRAEFCAIPGCSGTDNGCLLCDNRKVLRVLQYIMKTRTKYLLQEKEKNLWNMPTQRPHRRSFLAVTIIIPFKPTVISDIHCTLSWKSTNENVCLGICFWQTPGVGEVSCAYHSLRGRTYQQRRGGTLAWTKSPFGRFARKRRRFFQWIRRLVSFSGCLTTVFSASFRLSLGGDYWVFLCLWRLACYWFDLLCCCYLYHRRWVPVLRCSCCVCVFVCACVI